METDIASSAPSPEQTAAGGQLQRAIVEEIQALSATLRDTLLLAQAGELTYDEIAVMTKTPLGTIKWRVSEARKVIRKKLKERGFADAG